MPRDPFVELKGRLSALCRSIGGELYIFMKEGDVNFSCYGAKEAEISIVKELGNILSDLAKRRRGYFFITGEIEAPAIGRFKDASIELEVVGRTGLVSAGYVNVRADFPEDLLGKKDILDMVGSDICSIRKSSGREEYWQLYCENLIDEYEGDILKAFADISDTMARMSSEFVKISERTVIEI